MKLFHYPVSKEYIENNDFLHGLIYYIYTSIFKIICCLITLFTIIGIIWILKWIFESMNMRLTGKFL